MATERDSKMEDFTLPIISCVDKVWGLLRACHDILREHKTENIVILPSNSGDNRRLNR
jgi:hypothetical protein